MGFKIITINIQKEFIDFIEKLVEKGKYPSRSEAFRFALKYFIEHEIEFDKAFVNRDEVPIKKEIPEELDSNVFVGKDGRMWHITPNGVKSI